MLYCELNRSLPVFDSVSNTLTSLLRDYKHCAVSFAEKNCEILFILLIAADEKSAIEEFLLPEKPETVMFAAYGSTPKYPVKVSVLGEMVRNAVDKCRLFIYFL